MNLNIANSFIRENDSELAKFLDEELSMCANIPAYFDDYNYIPTEDEIKTFTKVQLEYLVMSANVDESDELFDNGELSRKLRERNLKIKSMINEELRHREFESSVVLYDYKEIK